MAKGLDAYIKDVYIAKDKGSYEKKSLHRSKFLLWWFSPPNWVNVNCRLIFSSPFLSCETQSRFWSMQGHGPASFMCKHTRALLEVPEANSRIVGGQIIPQRHIGIAIPVNLLGQRLEPKESSLCFCSKYPKEVFECWRKKSDLRKERSGQRHLHFYDIFSPWESSPSRAASNPQHTGSTCSAAKVRAKDV